MDQDEQPVLHYDVQGGEIGYYDTDGNGRVLFCPVRKVVGPFGVRRADLDQMRRDAPTKEDAARRPATSNGEITENERKYLRYRAGIIDCLCRSEHVTVSEVAEYVGCNNKRARRHLHALADEGLVEYTTGGVRNYWWVA